jgi:diguanylate cyclase (GGDEF)-like protein
MDVRFHDYIIRQIPALSFLSVVPGAGYLFLGWQHQWLWAPTALWFGAIFALMCWGVWLYLGYRRRLLAQWEKEKRYRWVLVLFYSAFFLWALIFELYSREQASNLHYVAIFTQIGAATVVSTFLYPDPRLYRPLIPLMMAFLAIYYAGLGEWYGPLLAIFSVILGGVLLFGAEHSYQLLLRTHRQATHDMLTGLYNRHWFSTQLDQSMVDLRRQGGCSALMLIDLDHFKTVNDSLGHETGDGLLREVARRLRSELPPGYHLARLGGDEFIVISRRFPDLRRGKRATVSVARRLLHILKQTYVISGHHIYISGSIGVRFFSAEEEDAGRLIREADIAMYEAKAAGRDGVFLFSEETSRRVRRHLEVERLLHFAIEKGEISLRYQPIHGREGRLAGAEVLARWESERLGEVFPLQFVPVAEQTGIIIELGQHVLDLALRALREWYDAGLRLEHFSINLSVRQCIHPGFGDQVEVLCRRHLTPELCAILVFEITETVISEEISRVVAVMNRIQRLGIRFSMDDFGTGYSALGYLKKLPVDELKIDRSFIEDVEKDDESRSMVTAILGIARFLGLRVVAEGVENPAQLEFLERNGCDLFQGFHFSPPLLREEFETFWKEARGRESNE